MYFNVIKATYLNDYKINLSFKNGKSGIVDLTDYIKSGDIFKKLNDLTYFQNFIIEMGAISWGDGAVDIAPERLYEMATGEVIILENLQTLQTR